MSSEAPVVLAITRANQRVLCIAATHCDWISCARVSEQGLEQSIELTIRGIIGKPEVPGHATHAALYLTDAVEGTMCCQILDCDFFWEADTPQPVLRGTAASVHQVIGAGVEFEE